MGVGRKRPDVLRNVLVIARTSEDAIQVTFADFSSHSRPIPIPSSLLPSYDYPVGTMSSDEAGHTELDVVL